MKYTYKKNGYDISCYGTIDADSNFHIEYEDEMDSGTADDIDASIHNTWDKVCDYLIENGHTDILEIETC